MSLVAGRLLPAARISAPVAQAARAGAVSGAVGGALQPALSADFATEKTGQTLAGAAAGALLGPALNRAGTSLGRLVDQWRGSRMIASVDSAQMQDMVRKQLAADGIDAASLPQSVFTSLADDVRTAISSGKKLDLAATVRKQDFDALGLPATRGQLTRNPMQWQREVNTAGIDGVGEPLQQLFAKQTRAVDGRMGKLTQGAGEAFDDGARLLGMAKTAQDQRDAGVRAAYTAFRESTGRDLEVPLQGLAQDYAETLRRFGDTVPGAVRKQFEGMGLMSGVQHRGLTIEGAEDLIKTINANADPMNKPAFRALGELRAAVQKAITDGADSSASGAGAEAAQLANEARRFAADNFRNLAKTPGLQAAVDGMEPDQFIQRFVIGGKVNEIQRLGEAIGPEGRQVMAAQLAKHLQAKAFGANVAGDGKVAADAFNRELSRIGMPKLEALLGADGAAEVQRLGRVLAYIKQVPEGATPNTSGSGQLVASLMGKAKVAGALPWVNEVLAKPLGTAAQKFSVSRALAPVPQQAADLDPATVASLSRLFAPAPFAAGMALGK